MVISSPWSAVYPSVKVAISATQQGKRRRCHKALCLVFNLIMTSAIIALLLASVDNSAADAVAMPTNLAFQRPGRNRALSPQQEAPTLWFRPLVGFLRGSLNRSKPHCQAGPWYHPW